MFEKGEIPTLLFNVDVNLSAKVCEPWVSLFTRYAIRCHALLLTPTAKQIKSGHTYFLPPVLDKLI